MVEFVQHALCFRPFQVCFGMGSHTVYNSVSYSSGMWAERVCLKEGQQTEGLVTVGGCGQSLHGLLCSDR